jgi:hypothetical protein
MPFVALGLVAPRGSLIFNTPVTQHLSIVQNSSRRVIFQRILNQSLVFVQFVNYIRAKNLNFTQALILNQTATKQHIITRRVFQVLGLQQTAIRSVTFNRTAMNTLVFNNYMTKETSMFGHPTIIIPTAIATIVSNDIRKQFVILEIPDRAISLPPPEFNDGEALMDTVITKRSMNNILYSWIRRNDLRKLRYVFPLGRPKALELRDFIYAGIGQVIKMTNWKGEIWMVNITNNPVELVLKTRYLNERELVNISVEFQGIKIAG